ncbi:MAG: hypothetical protein II875_06950 [Clostridia bacterium]|nr:hypothetical protein [Clostridia bacterium]
MLKDLGTRETNLKGIMATCKNCGRLFIRQKAKQERNLPVSQLPFKQT